MVALVSLQLLCHAFLFKPRGSGLLPELRAHDSATQELLLGIAYKNDPTIMSWQPANEPAGFFSGDSYDKWIAESAALIKSLDANHLVSTGAMGEVFQFSGNDQIKNNTHKDIDYTTVHIWVQNSGLYNPFKAEETYPKAVEVLHKQLVQHREMAAKLGKPLVFEEFGFSRDLNRFAAGTPVTLRDLFYAEAFRHVTESQRTDAPIAGVNIWAWGGEGSPHKSDGSRAIVSSATRRTRPGVGTAFTTATRRR
jgi:mannan endo-1,4-beta-mannosidase